MISRIKNKYMRRAAIIGFTPIAIVISVVWYGSCGAFTALAEIVEAVVDTWKEKK